MFRAQLASIETALCWSARCVLAIHSRVAEVTTARRVPSIAWRMKLNRLAFLAKLVQLEKGSYLLAAMERTPSALRVATGRSAPEASTYAKSARKMNFQTRRSQPAFLAKRVELEKGSCRLAATEQTRSASRVATGSTALVE